MISSNAKLKPRSTKSAATFCCHCIFERPFCSQRAKRPTSWVYSIHNSRQAVTSILVDFAVIHRQDQWPVKWFKPGSHFTDMMTGLQAQTVSGGHALRISVVLDNALNVLVLTILCCITQDQNSNVHWLDDSVARHALHLTLDLVFGPVSEYKLAEYMVHIDSIYTVHTYRFGSRSACRSRYGYTCRSNIGRSQASPYIHGQTDRDRQRQTETNRDRQRQTETDRESERERERALNVLRGNSLEFTE